MNSVQISLPSFSDIDGKQGDEVDEECLISTRIEDIETETNKKSYNPYQDKTIQAHLLTRNQVGHTKSSYQFADDVKRLSYDKQFVRDTMKSPTPQQLLSYRNDCHYYRLRLASFSQICQVCKQSIQYQGVIIKDLFGWVHYPGCYDEFYSPHDEEIFSEENLRKIDNEVKFATPKKQKLEHND